MSMSICIFSFYKPKEIGNISSRRFKSDVESWASALAEVGDIERARHIAARLREFHNRARAAVIYLLAHRLSPLRPLTAEATAGWWSWSDQFRYLRAATAWAGGDLDPAQHWYWPGYPLLAAPFVGLTPAQPFLIPDLLCLLAS
eukprot:gene34043-45631_t